MPKKNIYSILPKYQILLLVVFFVVVTCLGIWLGSKFPRSDKDGFNAELTDICDRYQIKRISGDEYGRTYYIIKFAVDDDLWRQKNTVQKANYCTDIAKEVTAAIETHNIKRIDPELLYIRLYGNISGTTNGLDCVALAWDTAADIYY